MTAAPEVATLPARLEAAWRRSDEIFALLDPAAWYERPIALRQPFIFYVGHLPAFAWNQVARGVLGRPGFEPKFDELFARGIDPVGVDRYEPDRPALWPEPAAVLAYRDRVRAALLAAFDAVAEREEADPLAGRGRIWHIALEHELMHHETLLYMIQQLRRDLVRRPPGMPAYRLGPGAPRGTAAVPGGEVTLGGDFATQDFGWDNEFPAHTVSVGAFDVDTVPVSNGDWLEFMGAGGYERADLWPSDAFAWLRRIGHRHPAFWLQHGGRWRYRTPADDLPLEDTRDWPVYVSWAEARAFARWRGGDLMSEAEYHRAAEGVPWDEPAALNVGFAQWAPAPAGSNSPASRHGVMDLVGGGWEWTGSRFAPFPGFTAYARTYPGYSADFFDEQHYVMLGGSWATDPALVRPTFRNWFQPHYPYVFAKFRCVYR